MATVQTLLHRFALRVDPRTNANAEFTTATIGTTAGERFSAQRLLDIYNDARIALFQALKTSVPPEDLPGEIPGIYKEIFINFTTSGDRQEYSLPSDYIEFGSLRGRYLDGSYVSAVTAPIIKLDIGLLPVVRQQTNTHYTESGSTRFVFEDQGKLFHVGALCGAQAGHGTIDTSGTAVTQDSGTTFLADLSVGATITASGQSKLVATVVSNSSATVSVAFSPDLSQVGFTVSDYRLNYFSIDTYVLADVTGGSVTEKINLRYHPALMDIAEAIAMEMGQNEVLALAKTLTGGK